jgi:hypothetical protein
VNAAVARDVDHVVVVAEIAGGIAPGSDRAALAVEAGLRAERGILVELLGAVVGVEQEREVVVPEVAAGGVDGLKREAGAVAEAGANGPAGLLLKGSAAGRRDNLGVDGGTGVCDVACRAAGRGGPQRDRGSYGKGRAAGQRRRGVFGGDDVGLYRVLGSVGRIARGHHALVERALRRDAVVAANAENDGALLAHRIVSRRAWACAGVVRRQCASGSVGATDCPLVWPSLDSRSDKTVGDRRVTSVVARAGAREQAVLQIGHDPRPAAGTTAPAGAVAKVNGLHVAVARIVAVGLGVAIVEATTPIEVGSVEDRVHALRRVTGRAAADGVVPVASAGRDEDAVRLLAVQGDRGASRAGQVVVAIGLRPVEAAGWCLGEVIAAAGLVVNDGDEAGCAGAEGVLGGGIRNTAGGQRRDVGRGIVGAALHLIERASEGAVQCTSSAVRRDARCAAGGVEVTWSSGHKGARSNKT